jgi:hypothetical protein
LGKPTVTSGAEETTKKIIGKSANARLTRGAAARHQAYWEASAAPGSLRDEAPCVNAFNYADESGQRLFFGLRGTKREVYDDGGDDDDDGDDEGLNFYFVTPLGFSGFVFGSVSVLFVFLLKR